MRIVYKLDQPGDCEGRSVRTVGIFTRHQDAVVVAKSGFGNHSWGPSAGYITNLEIFDSVQEFAERNPEYDGTGLSPGEKSARLRAQALAKLSPEEREALNIR